MSFRTSILVAQLPGFITFDHGHAVEGVRPEPITIQCSIQPLTPHQIQALPEGRRNSKSFVIFTDTDLGMLSEVNPIFIIIGTEEFEVWKKSPWQNGVINHYQYTVIKKLET